MSGLDLELMMSVTLCDVMPWFHAQLLHGMHCNLLCNANEFPTWWKNLQLLHKLKLIDCLRHATRTSSRGCHEDVSRVRQTLTRWTPPDYWQTDNSNGLVMVIRNYHWLNSASRVLISTCSAPLVQTGERKQFSLFFIDLDLWPTTLTYNSRLAKVKIDRQAKNQGQRSNGSNRRAPTDKRMDTRTLPNVLSLLLRGR